MNCKNVTEVLYDYTRRELFADDAAAVEMHIKNCASCAEELKKLSKLSALLRADLKEPSPVILENIRKSLANIRRPKYFHVLKPALALAAGVLLLAGVFLYPNIDKKAKLSNYIAEDYNITESALYDNSEFEDVSFIYGNDYDNELY